VAHRTRLKNAATRRRSTAAPQATRFSRWRRGWWSGTWQSGDMNRREEENGVAWRALVIGGVR